MVDPGSLKQAWTDARAAWPGVELSEEAFATWVAERGGLDAASLAALNTRDLYLTCACSLGDERALSAFDATFGPSIDAALASLRMRDDHGDEIRQRLRAKLFVGARPRIGSYGGRGELGGWVRAAAIREALDLQRRGRREVADEDPLASLVSVPLGDPVLEALKERYREPMRAAFATALAALPAGDRTLLRYKYLDGATLEEIAALQRVHRATVARRLRELREELGIQTRGLLMKALGADAAEADSIIRLVHSQVDASLSALED